jgi:phosphinothricin tripeptide acetyl hydrolase
MSKPELTKLLEELYSPPPEPGAVLENAKYRESFVKLGRKFGISAQCKARTVSAGGVPAEWITAPGSDEKRVVLYLHGGGYVIGSVEAYRGHASRIAEACKCAVLLVEYRQGPEDPFPAALEDAVSSYRWLLTQGLAPSRIAIAGDSAGGGLTVATLVSLRDQGVALPQAGVCLSPWIDLECESRSMRELAGSDRVTAPREYLLQMARSYLGGADPRTPLASPLYADLSKLPRLLIQVGTAEILLDDSRRLAERARAAGVSVKLEEWDDMPHIWQFFAPVLSEGRDALAKIAGFLNERG